MRQRKERGKRSPSTPLRPPSSSASFLPPPPSRSRKRGGKGLFLTREKGEEEGCTKKAAAVGTELGIPPAKREKGGGEPQLRQGRRRFAKGVGAEGKGGKRPRLAERQKDKEERQTVAFRPFAAVCAVSRTDKKHGRRGNNGCIMSGQDAAPLFFSTCGGLLPDSCVLFLLPPPIAVPLRLFGCPRSCLRSPLFWLHELEVWTTGRRCAKDVLPPLWSSLS